MTIKRKEPVEASGLIERIVLEHSDYTGGQGLYSAQKVREILTHALAARDAEIELLKGVAEKAMDAAMANARDEYRALYSTTIASLKQEIAEAREAEREACAKVNTSAAEPLDVSENITSDFAQGWRAGQRAFREAIRARSNGGNDADG